MTYEPSLQAANYLQGAGVMQRGPSGPPVQNSVVPGLQPSSSYYSGSTGIHLLSFNTGVANKSNVFKIDNYLAYIQKEFYFVFFVQNAFAKNFQAYLYLQGVLS